MTVSPTQYVLATAALLVLSGCPQPPSSDRFDFSTRSDTGTLDERDTSADADQDTGVTLPPLTTPACWPMQRANPQNNDATPCGGPETLGDIRQIPGIEPRYVSFVRVDGTGTLFALGEDDTSANGDERLYRYIPGAPSAEVIHDYSGGWTPLGPSPGDMAIDHEGRIWLLEYRGDSQNPDAVRLAAFNRRGNRVATRTLDPDRPVVSRGAVRFVTTDDKLEARRWYGDTRHIHTTSDGNTWSTETIEGVNGRSCRSGEKSFHLHLPTPPDERPGSAPDLIVRDASAPSRIEQRVKLTSLIDIASGTTENAQETSCSIWKKTLWMFPRSQGTAEPSAVCAAPLENVDLMVCQELNDSTLSTHVGTAFSDGAIAMPPSQTLQLISDPLDIQILSPLTSGSTPNPALKLASVTRNPSLIRSLPSDRLFGVLNTNFLSAIETDAPNAGSLAGSLKLQNLETASLEWLLAAPDRIYLIDLTTGDDGHRRLFEITSPDN